MVMNDHITFSLQLNFISGLGMDLHLCQHCSQDLKINRNKAKKAITTKLSDYNVTLHAALQRVVSFEVSLFSVLHLSFIVIGRTGRSFVSLFVHLKHFFCGLHNSLNRLTLTFNHGFNSKLGL